MMGMAVRPNFKASTITQRSTAQVQPKFSSVYAVTGNAEQVAKMTIALKKEATQEKVPIDFHQGITVLTASVASHELFVITGKDDIAEYKLKLKEEQIALALTKKVRDNVISSNSKFTKELGAWRDSLFSVLNGVFERIKSEGPVNKVAQANASQQNSAALAKNAANNGLTKKVTITDADVNDFTDLLEKYNDLNQGRGAFPTNITHQWLFDKMLKPATNFAALNAKINKGTLDVATGDVK